MGNSFRQVVQLSTRLDMSWSNRKRCTGLGKSASRLKNIRSDSENVMLVFLVGKRASLSMQTQRVAQVSPLSWRVSVGICHQLSDVSWSLQMHSMARR